MEMRLLNLLLLCLITCSDCLIVRESSKAKHELDRQHHLSRRLFLETGVLSVVAAGIMPSFAFAENERQRSQGGKPSAPTEALLPAARCKLWVDRANKVTNAIAESVDKKTQYDLVLELNAVLSNRPRLFVSERTRRRTIPTTAQLTTSVSPANKEQYRSNRADMGIPDQLAAMLNQADVERQWGMLQYAESKREKGNEVRAAFNYYTSQLEFGDSYLLTASQEDKKRMIRNDELPSLASVITSDLDLRDLYRNQFLTAIEDVTAEVAFQARQGEDNADTTDVVELMRQASEACQQWFGLIPAKDVEDAVRIVQDE